jgi:hypothetical protein
MQLAGEICSICAQKILLDIEATWCAECSTIFHRNCVANAAGICPKCHRSYEAPERRFVYSRFCPECMRPNQPAEANCAGCGAPTRWDTTSDYERFVAHMRKTSREYRLRGLAELGFAAVCLAVFVLIILLSSRGPILVLPGIFLLGMFILVGDGTARLRHGRAIKHFE